jgi:hypothetical protein
MCDALSPEEKRSEHNRRVRWLDMMARTPECCRNATNMIIQNGQYKCLTCERVWEEHDGGMICVI